MFLWFWRLMSSNMAAILELGHVIFTEFPHPGSDERWVEVDTPEALSCLQHRLNSLHAGIRIEVLPDWP
jgi:hypothetical protein